MAFVASTLSDFGNPQLKMNQPETCKVLCQLETSPAELKQFYNMINQVRRKSIIH